MHTENLKKRILFVCYVLCLLALGYVALRILAYIEHAVLLLAASVLLAYLLKPGVAFFSRPWMVKIPRQLRLDRATWSNPANFRQYTILRRGLPWVASILLVYALCICLIVLVVSFVVPLVVHEFKNFLQNGLPTLQEQIKTQLDAARQWLTEHLPPDAAALIPEDYLAQIGTQAVGWAKTSLSGLPNVMGKFLGAVVVIFVIPVLTFYLLLDMDQLRRGFMLLFPPHRRPEAMELVDKIDDVLGRYIRGQLLVACIIGVTISFVLKLLGLPYAAIIGLFAGFTNLIPYVGTPIGMVAAFLVAFLMPEGGPMKGALVLLAMYCVYIVEGKIVVPTIVGKSVGLPPIVIVTSLIIGAELLGVPGMLLGVPCAAIIRVIIEHFIERRDRNEGTTPHHFVHGRGPTNAA